MPSSLKLWVKSLALLLLYPENYWLGQSFQLFLREGSQERIFFKYYTRVKCTCLIIPTLRYLTHSPKPGPIGPGLQQTWFMHAMFHGKITFLNLVALGIITYELSRGMIHFHKNGQIYQHMHLLMFSALAVWLYPMVIFLLLDPWSTLPMSTLNTMLEEIFGHRSFMGEYLKLIQLLWFLEGGCL